MNLDIFKGKEVGQILYDEPMKNHTTFKIGGPADIILLPSKEEEILEALRICREEGIPYFILGNGSNLLVRDTGIRGVVIKIGDRFSKIEINGDRVRCQGGALLSTIGKRILKASLAGFEFATGIPGTVGGGVTMNAGAYGGEMKDIVRKVRVIDMDNNILDLSNEDMKFGYRRSLVGDKNLVVLSVDFQLRKASYDDIKERIDELTFQRTSKQPLELPSGGSTFKRPQGYFAGKLIDDAGLRGLRYGDAQISEKHCGFVVNRGEANFQEVISLINTVQKIVRDKFEVDLETEIKIIGDKR